MTVFEGRFKTLKSAIARGDAAALEKILSRASLKRRLLERE
jgi:hypothetical protein